MLSRRTALLGLGAVPRALAQGVVRPPRARKPNVVFVSAETEYRSADTLSRIAQELEGRHGMRCKVLEASSSSDIPGLEALEDVDLAVLYLRFLDLPADQLGHIRAYVNSGRPLVALRTTTHAFNNWKEFGLEVLGAPWLYHYGHDSSTDVTVTPKMAGHPILKGVDREFHSRSWLYHVEPVRGEPLLMGTSVGPSSRSERVPSPVAWTRTYKKARVFYTSLGHPEDFDLAPFRTLLVNGIHWALDRAPSG
ncbi:MAG: hypothetical protein FJW37_04455 [Acidobacteria bacterium]|nr:hypothetical protein [Acidobacteriota bacterium]